MELSNIYIKKGYDGSPEMRYFQSLRYMAIFSESIIDGIECSEKDFFKIKEVDRLNIFTRDTVFDWAYKFKFSTLKNTVK